MDLLNVRQIVESDKDGNRTRNALEPFFNLSTRERMKHEGQAIRLPPDINTYFFQRAAEMPKSCPLERNVILYAACHTSVGPRRSNLS